jgi:hypothetical protein
MNMGLLGNLTRIVTAPIEIIDETFIKPIADLADDAVDGFTGDDAPSSKRR